MKFKIIFISFNILIVFSFLLIFLLPGIMLGSDFGSVFWKDSWYLAVIFFVLLVAINIIYFMNRKLLDYLETENWPALKSYLEDKLLVKKRFLGLYIKLYVSTCIATSSLEDLKKLEQPLLDAGKDDKWAVQLGIPYLLGQDAAAMKTFYSRYTDVKGKNSGWLKWDLGFALLQLGERTEALEIISGLFLSEDPVLRLVSLYLASTFENELDSVQFAAEKDKLGSAMNAGDFAKHIEREKENIQILFLRSIINDALKWMYKE